MKKMLKAMAVAAMAVMVSAGCSQSQTSEESIQAPAGEESMDQEKVELEFWELPYGPSVTYDPALQKLIDQYNSEDHGATVKLQVMSWSGFIEQIQTAIAAGSPPDITTSAYYGLMNYAAMGEALDLTDIVEKWKEEGDPILEDFLDGALEAGVYEGKQIALPYQTDPKTIYYRADILEDELGFTDLDKEVTWDKLLEICAAVKERYGDEIYPISFFTLDQGSLNAMLNVLFTNGASWINADGTRGGLEDPKALECLEFLKEMKDKGYFPDGMVSYNMADTEKLYASGNLAMVWISPFTHVKSNEELYKNTKIMGPIVGPSADQVREVTWAGGIMGFAQTEHPEETKEFIEWMVKNNEQLLVEGGGASLPVRKSYYENEFYQTDWMMSQYAKYRDYYVDLQWPAAQCPVATNQIFVQNILGKPVEAMLMGSEDLAGELKKTNDEINQLLEEFQ